MSTRRLALSSLIVALVAWTSIGCAQEMAFGVVIARSEALANDATCADTPTARNPLAEASARGVSPDGASPRYQRASGDSVVAEVAHPIVDTSSEAAPSVPDVVVAPAAPRASASSPIVPVMPTKRGGFRWQSVVPGAIK